MTYFKDRQQFSDRNDDVSFALLILDDLLQSQDYDSIHELANHINLSDLYGIKRLLSAIDNIQALEAYVAIQN